MSEEGSQYKLYYFKGRNTGIAARSAEEARAKKKRGGDEIVAVRVPTEKELAQMEKGIWVRTRRDGLPPHKSKYGRGRGQGPPRKEESASEHNFSALNKSPVVLWLVNKIRRRKRVLAKLLRKRAVRKRIKA